MLLCSQFFSGVLTTPLITECCEKSCLNSLCLLMSGRTVRAPSSRHEGKVHDCPSQHWTEFVDLIGAAAGNGVCVATATCVLELRWLEFPIYLRTINIGPRRESPISTT